MDWLTGLIHSIESLPPLLRVVVIVCSTIITTFATGVVTATAATSVAWLNGRFKARPIAKNKKQSSAPTKSLPNAGPSHKKNPRKSPHTSKGESDSSATPTISPTINPTISPIFNIQITPSNGMPPEMKYEQGIAPVAVETQPTTSIAPILGTASPATVNQDLRSGEAESTASRPSQVPQVSVSSLQVHTRPQEDRPHLAPSPAEEATPADANDISKDQDGLRSEVDIHTVSDKSDASVSQRGVPLPESGVFEEQHVRVPADNAPTLLELESALLDQPALRETPPTESLSMPGTVDQAVDESRANARIAGLSESASSSQEPDTEVEMKAPVDASGADEPAREDSILPSGQSGQTPMLAPFPTPLVEPATASGKLALPPLVRQRREERSNLRLALKYASFIVQEARFSLNRYQRTSLSERPFQNEVRILGILYEYLRGIQDLVGPFNSAMNKLDIDWVDGDPREILLSYPDPLNTHLYLGDGPWSPSELRREFTIVMRDMVQTARDRGHDPQRQQYSKQGFPNRRWVYILPKAKDDTWDIYDAQEDAGDEPVWGRMSEENINEEPDSQDQA